MNDLANLHSVHEVQMQSKIVIFLFSFFCFGLAVLFSVPLFFQNAFANEKNPVLILWLCAVASILSLLFGTVLAISFFRKKDQKVFLYDNGLVYSKRKTVRTIKWEEIESIKESITQVIVNGVPARKLYSYVIKTQNGNEFTIESILKDSEKIGERLKAEIFQRHFPIVWNQLSRGETIDFDKLTLNQNYISTAKGKTLSLPNIGKIDIENGKIRIFKKDSGKIWYSFNYSSMPNAPVFLAVLEKII